MEYLNTPAVKALFFGAFSALSLPIGAIVGILFKPSNRLLSAVMSFGAGALITAIAFELVTPALARHEAGFWPLAAGLLAGCVMFIVLSQLTDLTGAFMRKRATLVAHLRRQKKKSVKEVIEQLSQVDFLRALPAEQVQALIPC